MLQPCQNNGTCINNNSHTRGYLCQCSIGFDGTECQSNNQPCQSDTCWNDGVCNETSNTTFICQCKPAWQDIDYQTKINYCQNVICHNYNVYQALFMNYTCQCLTNSYSGRHCEVTTNRILLHQTVSKSFAYIAILVILIVAIFIVVMDVLKCCFGINPVSKELKKIKKANRKKKKKIPIIIRYTYVNTLATSSIVDCID